MKSPSKLPVVSGQDVIKALHRAGFQVVFGKGSHVNLKKDDRFVTVPLHKELDRGTLLAIIRQAGLTKEEFLQQL